MRRPSRTALHALIRAITLDLDDTLWAVAPAIERAELALDAFIRERCPNTAVRYPVAAMRVLRDRIASEHPHIAHDYSEQRRITLRHAFTECGDDPALVDDAFNAFYAGRNQVELYADVIDALQRLRRIGPLAALTNGNADIHVIGLGTHFEFTLGAREHGAAKPDPTIFHAACARLQRDPHEVLHVGDDPWLDVAGAAKAGLPTCWINRTHQRWPAELAPPDLEVAHLGDLADRLEAGTALFRRTA